MTDRTDTDISIVGYLVKYNWPESWSQQRALFLDKVTAEQYAVKYHGTVHALVEAQSSDSNGNGLRQEGEIAGSRT